MTAHAGSAAAVETRNGVRIIPDRAGALAEERRVLSFPSHKPAEALDLTLEAITSRHSELTFYHGELTSYVVAMQLESTPATNLSRQTRATRGAIRNNS